MGKTTGRDFPLSPTPKFEFTQPSQATDSTFRQKLRAAKQAHKLEAARNGTLSEERAKKWKDAVGIVKDVVETASSAVNAATGIKSMSGGGGRNDGGGMYKRK